MDITNHVERIVRILDATVEQQLGDENNPKFTQLLHLLLRDINTEEIISTTLNDDDICRIVGIKNPLSSKQLIDLSIMLREREAPLKLMLPQSTSELSANDVINSRKLDQPQKRRRRRKKKNWQNNPKKNAN